MDDAPRQPSWFLPNGEAKTSEMIEDELRIIRSLVFKYTFTDEVDREQLTIDIWLEDPSSGPNRVRSRVIDALRSVGRRERHESQQAPADSPSSTPDLELINTLAKRAQVTTLEETLLYLRFWRGLSFIEMAVELQTNERTISAKFKALIERLRLASQNDGL